MKNVHRFHYLTQDLPDVSHQELAKIACRNGVRWVQLRVKNKPADEVLQIAREVRAITQQYNAVLIINDFPEIVLASEADGVHLGRNDMSISEARKILAPDKIIGGTANTVEDVLALQEAGVEYIGLGPFRFTPTKEKLAPVLGLEGYIKLSTLNSQLSTPVIAIGGILPEDVQDLMQAGVYGVAVSSAINHATDKAAMIRQFLDQFPLTSR